MSDDKPKGLNIKTDAAAVFAGPPLTASPADVRLGKGDIWKLPEPAPGVMPSPKIAMDWAPQVGALFNWAAQGAFSEGIGFMGFPYLAQLTQRAEYRRISEIIALEMTRKWITVTSSGEGDDKKIQELNKALDDFQVQALFRQAAEHDGFFGRAQIFVEQKGVPLTSERLATPLIADPRTIEKGGVAAFRIVEPMWSYPGSFNADNPLSANFYDPQMWYVNGTEVHKTRLLTFVSRELPDMLKPAYAFAGLSMSQMAKPYIDNWLRTRQSVSDLLHAFSVMVLSTDMASVLQNGAGADSLVKRAQLFTQGRDNRGLMLVDKETEELANIAVPLGTLDALQAQSQEQMASVAGIPLVVLLGITPSGLNASSDGEIRTFYAKIAADQERVFRPHLTTVLKLVQLHLWGAVDPDIGFRFNPLWEEDEATRAANRKTQADTDAVYVGLGVVDAEEVRERLAADDESPYHGLDLNKTIDPPIDPSQETDPDEEDDAEPVAQDAWNKDLAASAKSVRLMKADGRQVLVGPDMSKPGGFRVTRIDTDGVPNGHVEFEDMEEALNEALREGYVTREDLAQVAANA